MYGYRALDTPFGNPSAFEFLRYWTAEALGPPSSSDANTRTEWTEAGPRLLGTASLDNGRAKLSPGVHYGVLDQQIKRRRLLGLPSRASGNVCRSTAQLDHKTKAAPVCARLERGQGTERWNVFNRQREVFLIVLQALDLLHPRQIPT